MKRTWQCPKCQSQRVGYLERVHGSATGKDIRLFAHASVGGGAFGARQAQGEIESFVCTECGYFEEYLKNPQNIDWEKFVDFRWCNRGS